MIDIIVKKITAAIGTFSQEHGEDKMKCQFVIYAETVLEDFNETFNYKKHNGTWYVTYKPGYEGTKKFSGWQSIDSAGDLAKDLEKKYHSSDYAPKPKFDFIKNYDKAKPLEKNVNFLKIYNEPVDLLNIGFMANMFIDGAQKNIANEHGCLTTDVLVFIALHPKDPNHLILPIYIKGQQKGYTSFAKLFGEETPA